MADIEYEAGIQEGVNELEKYPSNTSLNGGNPTGKFSRMVSELGRKMYRRQDQQDLIQKGILREDDAVSPTILQKKMELEKARTQDLLNRRISNRPDKSDLKQRNILRVESNDSLDQSGLSLNKSISFDKKVTKLRSILKQRPEKTHLEDLNIISPGNAIDPSLISTQKALAKKQLENSLEAKLRERPNPEEMDRFLNFAEVVEVLPTFRKSEYNRKPDTNATFKKLTPQMKVVIREELNSFKKNEMPVHEDSSMNTCFH